MEKRELIHFNRTNQFYCTQLYKFGLKPAPVDKSPINNPRDLLSYTIYEKNKYRVISWFYFD